MVQSSRRSALPLVLVGFVSIAAQGLLFREHLRLYGGDEIGIGIFLGSWLLWIAAGSLLHRCLPGSRRLFPVASALLPFTALLAAWLLWQARAWAGLGPTEVFPPSRLLPLTLLAVAPVSLTTGWLIPAGARWVAAGNVESEAVGRAWAAEALGGALGGALVTLVLVLGTTPLALMEDSRRAALPIPDDGLVLETLDTPYTSWTAVSLGGGVAFYGDGALRTHLTVDGGEAWTAAALLAQRPGARRAGILGVGAEHLACRLLDAGLERVTMVVRDPAWPGLLARHAPPALTPCLEDSRLVWRHGDRPPADASWDLAWLQHTDPGTAAAARFLTRSSIARVGEALTEGGVLGLSIAVTENVLEGPALAYARAVDATLAAVFDAVAATGGERMLFLASDGPVITDPGFLAARLDRGPGPRLGIPGAGLSVGFETNRIATRRDRMDAAPGRPILEQRPVTHLLHLMLEGEASGDPLVAFLVAKRGLVPWLVLAISLAVLLAYGRRVRRGVDGATAPVALVAFGGGAAMAWQLVLFLVWQLRFGSLAAAFGVLSGLFMLGLWAGATAATRLVRTRAVGPDTLAGVAAGLLGAGALLLATLHLGAGWDAGALLVATALALGLAGGMVIPVAAALLVAAGDAPAVAAGRLSAGDHLGAVAAVLAAGLALVPTVGFSGTVILGMSGVGAAGALALLSARAGAVGGIPSGSARWRGRARFTLIITAALALLKAAGSPGTGPDDPAFDAAEIPGGLSAWEHLDAPFPHRVRRGADGRIQRIRIKEGAPRVQGYEGYVSLYLDLDREGIITDAKMGPHRETPSYVWGIEGWVEALRGYRASGLQLRGEGPAGALEVDALTGATVTCRSLLASARGSAAAAQAARDAVPIPLPAAPAPPRAEVAEESLEAAPAEPDAGPRLHRKDAKQTPHQRDVDRTTLERRIREGTLSDHEASYYLPVVEK